MANQIRNLKRPTAPVAAQSQNDPPSIVGGVMLALMLVLSSLIVCFAINVGNIRGINANMPTQQPTQLAETDSATKASTLKQASNEKRFRSQFAQQNIEQSNSINTVAAKTDTQLKRTRSTTLPAGSISTRQRSLDWDTEAPEPPNENTF